MNLTSTAAWFLLLTMGVISAIAFTGMQTRVLASPRLSPDITAVSIKMGLRWCRDVFILSQPKRYLDDRQARKYWVVSFRKIR
jgi:hypothetical protein